MLLVWTLCVVDDSKYVSPSYSILEVKVSHLGLAGRQWRERSAAGRRKVVHMTSVASIRGLTLLLSVPELEVPVWDERSVAHGTNLQRDVCGMVEG